MPPKRIFVLIWLLFYFSLSHAQDEPVKFIIASGSRGGNYYRTGEFIEAQYNHYIKPGKFLNIQTNGSVENIELLRNNKVDFAILQRDVLLRHLYGEEKTFRNMVVIIPLFRERLNLYLYDRKDRSIYDFNDEKAKRKFKIGVTDLDGYSYRFFRMLLKYLNIDAGRFIFKENNYNLLIDSLKAGKLDVLVSFSLPLKTLENDPRIHHIYLTGPDARMLSHRLRNVLPVDLDGKGKHFSLGTWSFLVGSQKSMDYLGDEKLLTDALLQPPVRKRFKDIASLINHHFQQFLQNKNGEMALLANLPVSAELKHLIGWNNFDWKRFGYLFLLILIMLLILYLFFRKRMDRFRLRYLWYRYKHFLIGFVILILMYFLSIEFMVLSERDFFYRVGIKSPILNLTFGDLVSWILITTITGNTNGIFPLSLAGKAMLALNSLNFWIGTFLVGVSEYVAYTTNKKRKAGLMSVQYNNHLVLFGWNDYSADFVQGILDDARHYHNTRIKLVCVVPDVDEVRERHPGIKKLHDSKIIDLIKGDALEPATLEKAAVENAHTVVLLSDRNKEHADERTVMRAFAISRYVRRKANDGKLYRVRSQSVGQKIKEKIFRRKPQRRFKFFDLEPTADRVYMIAELNSPEFKETLVEADVNEIFIAGNYRKAILKQAIFNHGISQVLNEIVNFNEDNEFYKIDLSLPENAHLVGKTFDELLVLLRQVDILLIAIQLIFRENRTGQIIIDREKIKTLLEKEEHGITKDIIVNPSGEKERNRPVDDDDHLIVLARNQKVIREGIRRLRNKV